MGVEPTEFDNTWSWSDSPMFYCQGNREYVIDCVADYVKYATSWDALMPVINKLKSVWEEPEELDELRSSLWWNDINYVYEDVVELIKEYNKRNETNKEKE